jgi:hypothetical protein
MGVIVENLNKFIFSSVLPNIKLERQRRRGLDGQGM